MFSRASFRGYFQLSEEAVSINRLQPPDEHSPGGWQRIFSWLRSGRIEEALQFESNYLILQIDTDRQEDAGFDVSRREEGRELTLEERVERVIARLRQEINPSLLLERGERIFFAVAVEATECWLLPLLDRRHTTATKGCLDKANKAIRKKDRKGGLGTADKKFPPAYEKASKDYRKRTTLLTEGRKNPSLALFLDQLASRFPLPEPTEESDTATD